MILNKEKNVEVYEHAVPEFVKIVEEQRIQEPETMATIKQDLLPLKERNIDTLVLGCTHYPLMRQEIQSVMGPEVTLIDSGAETISEVSALLDYFNLSRTSSDNDLNPATQTYFTTGDGTDFAKFTQKLFNQPDLQVHEVEIVGDELVDNSNA